MSEVALSAAMRANLLTLQSTQRSMDGIQFNLATGRKVNSALDNPQSFFAAQALSNRAADLGRLLDGMGQSISTIQQADKGAAALTKMVQQADAIANQALTASSESREAKVVGTVNLTGVTDITALDGIANDDEIIIEAQGVAAQTVVLKDNDTIEMVLAKIEAAGVGNDLDIKASLDEQGRLQLSSQDNAKVKLSFTDGTNANQDLANALGFQDAVSNNPVDDVAEASVTLLSAPSLESRAFFNASGFAKASDSLADILASQGGANLFAVDKTTGADGDEISADIRIVVNGTSQSIATLSSEGAAASSTTTGTTIQGLVDNINGATALGIRASFDDTSGELSIRAVDADVTDIRLEVVVSKSADTVVGAVDVDFGFGFNGATQIEVAASDATGTDTLTSAETFRLGAAAAELAKLEQDFNAIRGQIDQLITDTGYQGVNLLNGDNLTTAFNADRSSFITTRGVTFNASGLGISAANFGSTSAVGGALSEIRDALTEVRQFGSSLANDLSVIQTRQDFTATTIQTLTEGADKLTLADQNEEGAKMLALQTRQQLGVVSLSLASQAQQSVLRLF